MNRVQEKNIFLDRIDRVRISFSFTKFLDGFPAKTGLLELHHLPITHSALRLWESIESVEKNCKKTAARRQLNTLRLNPKVQNHQRQQEKETRTPDGWLWTKDTKGIGNENENGNGNGTGNKGTIQVGKQKPVGPKVSKERMKQFSQHLTV